MRILVDKIFIQGGVIRFSILNLKVGAKLAMDRNKINFRVMS